MCDVILETGDATQDSCDVTGRKMAATQTSSDVTTQTSSDVATQTSRGKVTISDLKQENLRHVLQFLDSPQLFRVRQGELICTCSSQTHDHHIITCQYIQYTDTF